MGCATPEAAESIVGSIIENTGGILVACIVAPRYPITLKIQTLAHQLAQIDAIR